MILKQIIQDLIYKKDISNLDFQSRKVISTINAHSFCIAKKDKEFEEALVKSDILLPDGISIVLASRYLNNIRIKKIAGADVHLHLLEQANLKGEKIFYLGSSEKILQLIETKISKEYSRIKIKTFSPPFKSVFSQEDTDSILLEINNFKPAILFVGMTAPKQEKWVHFNKNKLEARIIVSIGAVFDFYAGTQKRAPDWIINLGLEWLYRFAKEPRRMWKRYLINNYKFLKYTMVEIFSRN